MRLCQLLRRALLADAALVQHDDLVGHGHGGQLVGNHDQRAPAAQPRQRLGDGGLVFGIQRGRGLIDQQNGRILDERTRDGDALALAARQARPALAHRRVQALRQALDDFGHAGLARGFHHLGIAGLRAAHADVVGNGALEKVAVLEDLADLPGQPLARDLAHVDAAHQNAALLHIEKACDQPQHGRFARARGAHQRRHRARLHAQAQAAQHLGLARRVAEHHIAQLHRGIARRLGHGRLGQRLDREDVAHGIELHARGAQRVGVAGHLQQRIDMAAGQQQGHDHGDGGFHSHALCCNAAQALVQPQRAGHQQGRKHGLHGPAVEHARQRRQANGLRARCALPAQGLLQPARAAAFAIEGAQHGLRLRKLHHALAGAGHAALQALVGTAAQVRGDQQHAGQQRQRQQCNQAHAPVHGTQRGHHGNGRHGAAEHGREHMGRQLGHFHHSLRDNVVEPGRVLGREPSHGQAGHMVAKPVARHAQHGGAQAQAGFFHLALPGPAQHHARQQHGQPGRGAARIACQQARQHGHKSGDNQAAEQAMQHGHAGIAAEKPGVVAQQLHQGLQHGGSSGARAGVEGRDWEGCDSYPPSAHSRA